jgi:hypothetical protein
MRFCYNRPIGDLTGGALTGEAVSKCLREDLTANVFVRALVKAGNDAEETC